jgi:hypothetical protein
VLEGDMTVFGSLNGSMSDRYMMDIKILEVRLRKMRTRHNEM